ncbi:P-loop containing nucleoside triphosphate hydrolase protein [Flagelloscypha sp. PMI_526]|nr:P-loop containing nucleoside triphosphate hydrolase protein [Flagelloscypha sp. PMI_526]
MAVPARLAGLNAAQLNAVLHSPTIPLQILAGPGSGKTRVLTSRIAHLILQHEMDCCFYLCGHVYQQSSSGNEGEADQDDWQVHHHAAKLGTFHALCAMFLRRYGALVGLEKNFTVCDAEESKKMIAQLLKNYKNDLADKDITLKEGTVLSMISKHKAKGHSPETVLSDLHTKSASSLAKASTLAFVSNTGDIERIVAEIYRDYDRALRRSNSLDFDDLLVFGVKLFMEHAVATDWCKHILVDEFQDTNITQYELMKALASHHCVSTVGDPDQSIYAWRSAEVGNLARMRKDFPSVQQIYLEENYRSTQSILKASLAIVSQDKNRIQKSLHSSHPMGPKPLLTSHASEYAEATFIAQEIKRMFAQMGGTLNWGDFVVLLRFNALSRSIESALQRESIPSRVLAGHKFFERLEIKDLLSYLQLVDNPSYQPAFIRAVNVPSRGIGDKTLLEIAARATKTKVSNLEAVEKICDGKTPDIKPSIKSKLAPFVRTMKILRRLAQEGASPPDLIRRLLDLIEYEAHLRKTQQDWESRWENVQELITFASEVDISGDMAVDEGGHPLSEEVVEPVDASTPLRLFLQASMLSSEGDNDDAETSKEKVTISTCHAAKGLEWPVVFIPAVEQGTYPFYRTEDVEEERRLLYVGCTRAQALLSVSWAAKRKMGGETKGRELSPFVRDVVKQEVYRDVFTDDLGATRVFGKKEREEVARVLSREVPDEEEVERRVREL